MEEAGPDLTGEIVDGRFRVEEKLGSGGMGTVWRVQHVVSLQRLALKTLGPSYGAEGEATTRFLREARAAAGLKTRHVVKIVDADMEYRHQGAPLPFLVMELLEGQTLQALLDARNRLSPGELGWAAAQLGRALDAAHRQGIVHRDLKPSNVFVAEDEDGQPIIKLCDFGIAKLIGAAVDGDLATRTGVLLGTPMYLAPELLRGAGAAVPATDQWSLGLIAFRALAGWDYFGHIKGFPELVLTIASDPLPVPSGLVASLPAAFDAWFLRSCARDPAARFTDVPAQVAALIAALGNPAARPIALRSPPDAAAAVADAGAPQPLRSPAPASRRRRVKAPARALFFASALVWALAALALLSWLGNRGRPPLEVSGRIVLPVKEVEPPAAAVPELKPTVAPGLATSRAPSLASVRATPAIAGAAPVPVAPQGPVRKGHARSHAPLAASPSDTPSRGRARGAACGRSAECASGLCAAESCL